MVHILGQQQELQRKALLGYITHLFATRPISENKLAISVGQPKFENGVILTAEIFLNVKGARKFTQVVTHPTNIGDGYSVKIMVADADQFVNMVKDAVIRILKLVDMATAERCMKGVL